MVNPVLAPARRQPFVGESDVADRGFVGFLSKGCGDFEREPGSGKRAGR